MNATEQINGSPPATENARVQVSRLIQIVPDVVQTRLVVRHVRHGVLLVDHRLRTIAGAVNPMAIGTVQRLAQVQLATAATRLVRIRYSRNGRDDTSLFGVRGNPRFFKLGTNPVHHSRQVLSQKLRQLANNVGSLLVLQT